MAITVANDGDIQGWPQELYVVGGSAFERRVRCAWSDRLALAIELDTYPDSLYPYNTSSGAILNKIKIEPEKNSKSSDAGNGKISYNTAILICNYSTTGPQYFAGKGLITETLSAGRSGWRFDESKLYWGDGEALKENEPPRKIECGLTYMLRYHARASVPDAVRLYPGYINSNSVATAILGVTFAVNTLLYQGARVHRILKTGSVSKFDVRHYFSYRYNATYGWNYFWRQSANGYERVYRDAGGANQLEPYPETAFGF